MKKAKIVYSIFVIMVVIILPLSLYIKSQVEETIFNNSVFSVVSALDSYKDYSVEIDDNIENEYIGIKLIVKCNSEFDKNNPQYIYESIQSCLKCDEMCLDFFSSAYADRKLEFTGVEIETSRNEYSFSKGIFLINGQEVVVSDGTVIGGDSLIIPEFDKNYFDNIKNDQEKEKEYKLVKGVNGVYTYRCMKKCSEECGSSCKSCIMNGESFKRPPYCNFDYSAPTKIGWIGCPNCGDVSSSRWNDWYKRKLDEAYDSK